MVAFGQLTDIHLVDAQSPARVEFADRYNDGPGSALLFGAAYRPHEMLTTHVADRIVAESTAFWRTVFAAADCCCCPVASLQDAIANPHFIQRGLFAHHVTSDDGRRMPALPVPIDPTFRDPPGDLAAPTLGT